MTPNNNLSVLPFYTDIDEQNHRKAYAYGNVYPLFCPIQYIVPFQVMRQHRDDEITSVKLYTGKGDLVADITANMQNTGLQIVPFENDNLDVIVYTGILPLNVQAIAEGQHYIVMTDGVETWYSDFFTIVNNIAPYIKIEWADLENFVTDSGIIVYNAPTFRNILYLCTEIGKPDYEFEEEGENRNGYFFPEKQLSYKVYKCTILAPEYLCDVMRLIRMADIVKVTDKFGNLYECNSFLITPKWQGNGDLASVEIEFRTNTIAKKIGKGYTIRDNGDFNIDFNNDFNNGQLR